MGTFVGAVATSPRRPYARAMLGQLFRRLWGSTRRSRSGPAPQPPSNSGGRWTIGVPTARHPYEVEPNDPAADIIGAMEFCATFQVRTPLRILQRHGQLLPLGSTLSDDFESWMGIWTAKPKSWRELGINADEMEHRVASPAGPVTAVEYLPFLLAVRRAVEATAGGTEGRIARLRAVCDRSKFARYVAAEGGTSKLCDRFFPPVLSLIPGLPSGSQDELRKLRFLTVADLRGASDDVLRAVKGIGPGKLKAIRKFCAEFTGDQEAERAVNLVI